MRCSSDQIDEVHTFHTFPKITGCGVAVFEEPGKSMTPPTNDGLADEDTPFSRNAWYVACFSRDIVPGKPFARRILGENVVFYRKADGTVVAMKDRCPHRSFPLSCGRTEGDDIICGYHGIRFGSDGVCKLVPTQASAPRALSVATFTIDETAPIVWISMMRRISPAPAPWMPRAPVGNLRLSPVNAAMCSC